MTSVIVKLRQIFCDGGMCYFLVNLLHLNVVYGSTRVF
jgi:hypothetical protein